MEAKCGADCRKRGCDAPRGCPFGKRCFDNGADPRIGPVSEMVIIRICDRPELIGKAAKWFREKWGIPEKAYRESMEASLTAPVPCWYLCLDGETIAGGMGVIENDFNPRTDLAPNVCAVYTEEAYRGQGIAGQLLDYVAKDMAGKGIDTLYLVTNHVNLYERYGWSYLCPVETEDGMNRVYVHKEET